MIQRKKIIGVIGAGLASIDGRQQAYRVGQLIAEYGALLVCGGLDGIMEAASQGCHEAGGQVIGILPGESSQQANPYVSVPIVTNMGHARNIIIAHTAQALIAIEGEYGTLSELAIGLKLGKPVIQLGSWSQFPETLRAENPEHAVKLAWSAIESGV